MHVGDLDQGMVPAIAIVAGNIPLATGIALSYKMRSEPHVAVSFMGDGAINEGAFHEAVNMGAIWKLPVLYVIENNRYAASTPVENMTALDKLSDRAAGYGIPGVTIDGNDVEAVYEATQEALAGARAGDGPTLLELETYRIWKHAAAKDFVIWLYPPATQVHLVPHLLEAFPEVRVVINHLGVCPGEGQASRDEKGRPHIEAPEYNPAFHTTYRFSKYENVAVKLSGQYAFSREQFPYRDLTRWHQRLYASYGSKRLMWATDFPWILEDPGYGPLTTIIGELLPDLSDEEHADIMGNTAKAFLGFPFP